MFLRQAHRQNAVSVKGQAEEEVVQVVGSLKQHREAQIPKASQDVRLFPQPIGDNIADVFV